MTCHEFIENYSGDTLCEPSKTEWSSNSRFTYIGDTSIVFSCVSSITTTSRYSNDLRVQRMRTHFSNRAFSAAGPRCWNSLPPAIRLADSVDSFKVQLKTYLFAKVYRV